MRLHRAAWPAFASSCLLAFCVFACGSSKSSNVNADGSTGATGTGANGTGASGTMLSGGGPSLVNVGGTNASGGESSVDNQCAGTLVEAQRIPLDMYVMLDVSGSMLEATQSDANVTKWQAVSSALTDFVSDKASDGIGVGLQVFPIGNSAAPVSCNTDKECGTFGPCLNRACWPLINGAVSGCLDDNGCALSQTCVVLGECSKDTTYVCNSDATANCSAALGACTVPPSVCVSATDCQTATYATPAAVIAALPGGKDAIVKVIAASTPDPAALTPTGPALSGAIQQAKTWGMAHTDHQVVAVLATDGLPTLKTSGMLCAPVTQQADINAVVNLATKGKAGTPSISTFVIGVVGPDDTGAPAILNSIAMAGSSGNAFIVDTTGNVQTQFRDALNKIRATGLSCELAVPTADAGKTVDYGQVNVAFDSGMGPVNLESVPSVADCAAHPQAWYYNVDPAQGTPTRIEACPGICTDFEKTDMGSVKIELGCKTRVVVK